MAWWRTLRIATFCCSAYLPASLAISRRRSSVRGGMGMRRFWPSTTGFRPRPAARIAFSTDTTTPRSQTLTVSERASGALTVATWFRGMEEP